MKDFNIIYRVCDSCENYNSRRVVGSKAETIEKSVISLCKSIKMFVGKGRDVYGIERVTDKVKVFVVFDNTSNKVKQLVTDCLSASGATIESYNTEVHGNMESFKLSYHIAKRLEGYLFFLEDDYLLSEACISEMYWFLTRFVDGSHVCIKPHHEWWAFTRDNISNGKYTGREVLFGKSLYWVRDFTSTCTFCIDDYILNNCSDLFLDTFNLDRVKEDFLNKIWRRFPLFCSIPPVGIHYHSPETFNPYFDRKADNSLSYDSKMTTIDTEQ